MRSRAFVCHGLAVVTLISLVACAGGPAASSMSSPRPAARLAEIRLQREVGVHQLSAMLGRPGVDERAVARELGRLGSLPARQVLHRLLASAEPGHLEAAALGLALAASPADEAVLVQRLAGASPAEAEALIVALGKLGGEKSLSLLASYAAVDSASVSAAAGLAIGQLGKRGVTYVPEVWRALAALAARQGFAQRYAGLYGLAHGGPVVKDAVIAEVLEERLADSRAESRALAVKAMGHVDGGSAHAASRVEDPDPWVRVAAVRVLGQSASGRDRLVDRLLGLRGHALQEALTLLSAHLASLGGGLKAPIARLSAALASSPEAEALEISCLVRRIAISLEQEASIALPCDPSTAAAHRLLLTQRLGEGAGPGLASESMTTLRELFADPDPLIRAAAVRAAIRAAAAGTQDLSREELDAARGLVVLALRERSDAVAGAAAEALAETGAAALAEASIHDALSARARIAWRESIELFTALTTAMLALDSPDVRQLCIRAQGHPNRTARAQAAACLLELDEQESPDVPIPVEAIPTNLLAPGMRFVLWVLETERGTIEIDLDAEIAPWNVSSVVALSRSGYYDGVSFHRVVPGFVVQGGDPSGTGWGSPYNVPAEHSLQPFDRGAVGIADAGLDTGGSQFFFMHARAPHLEGRYTWIGKVRPASLATIDRLRVGDKILKTSIRAVP